MRTDPIAEAMRHAAHHQDRGLVLGDLLDQHERVVERAAAPAPDDLDAGSLKEQLADAEQRVADAEEGSAARGRAAKDRDRAQAFLAIAEG